jgi:hypothetical protein
MCVSLRMELKCVEVNNYFSLRLFVPIASSSIMLQGINVCVRNKAFRRNVTIHDGETFIYEHLRNYPNLTLLKNGDEEQCHHPIIY